MCTRIVVLAVILSALPAAEAIAQCLHGANETADQAARRKDALAATRIVNTIQANQAGAASGRYLRHGELSQAPAAASLKASPNPALKQLSLEPESEIMPGWKMTLDLTENGYWFMVRDSADPCGFAFISNQAGLIFTAQPLR